MYKQKVAAYVRIASDCSGQYAKRLVARWEREIRSHSDWEFAGVYIDIGDTRQRTEFDRLLDDCKHWKVDLITTPTVTRFGRNLVDAMNTVRGLFLQTPSVGVIFEREKLDTTGDGNIPALLTIHEMVVGQSRKKTAYAAARA